MALPNPALDHKITDDVLIAATSRATVIAAIKAAINSLPAPYDWTAVDATTGDAVNNPGLLISAPATSPIPKFRIIIGMSDVGITNKPAAAEYASPDTAVSDGECAVGFGIDDKDGAVNWHDTGPLGTKWFTKFNRWLPISTGTRCWVIASKESIMIRVRGVDDVSLFGFWCGALIGPLKSGASNAEADERIYGLHTFGMIGNQFETDWHTSQGDGGVLRNHSGANNSSCRFWIKTPGADTNKDVTARTVQGISLVATGADTYKTPDGLSAVLDFDSILVFEDTNPPTRCYGRLRGAAYYGDTVAETILTEGGVDKAVCVSGDLAGARDSLALRSA